MDLNEVLDGLITDLYEVACQLPTGPPVNLTALQAQGTTAIRKLVSRAFLALSASDGIRRTSLT
jgi:hypothetical protein